MNSRDREGKTALMWSIINEHKKIVKFLLKQPGIDVNVRCANGFNALHTAVANQELEMVKLILKNKNVDVNCKTPNNAAVLCCAAVFHIAVDRGNLQIVRMFLAHKDLDVNLEDEFTGNTALTIAITRGHLEMVKFLLAHPKVDINYRDAKGRTPLTVAPVVEKNNVQIVEMFLDNKYVDVNLEDTDTGHTALTAAAAIGDVEIVRMTLAHPKVDVNHRDKRGITGLMMGLFMAKEQLVKLFLADERLDATSVNRDGYNALHYTTFDSAEMVELIMNDLRFSSMVNKPNKFGDTALMFAVLHCNHTAVAKLLLYRSVDMDLTNNDGENLEDLARY